MGEIKSLTSLITSYTEKDVINHAKSNEMATIKNCYRNIEK